MVRNDDEAEPDTFEDEIKSFLIKLPKDPWYAHSKASFGRNREPITAPPPPDTPLLPPDGSLPLEEFLHKRSRRGGTWFRSADRN